MSQRFVLYVVDDGEWHSICEVAETLDWSKEETIDAARYLAKGRFVHFDEDTGKIKLEPWIKEYPRGTWTGPGKRASGAVSLPPDASITLQKTLIQNNLGVETEINFLVEDDRLVELVISREKRAPP